ncbi:HEPN domain-containing protein [Methanobacterium petrolearium]|uniref:HEPN domain-containing protein n=1 Tax=Methanobacterium petrolearium TaxID=710190 RepID=UPI001AE809D1|nr:HEPN domain-containing protein [Methanobacterium petrolearium]MBP1947016.1 uncharacterized protein (UPF0332 family) [Methanobacterium petrolearium]BDZ71444.1 HEPN domain-containing protein [Methanobacterium petrolearium]
MKELEKHLERSEDKLESAHILLENNQIADSISTSYYSIYHATMALLKLRNIHPRTHAGLISEFGLKFIKNGTIEEDYARMLVKAETERIKADYDVDYTPSRREAEDVFKDAENFLHRIKKAIEELK